MVPELPKRLFTGEEVLQATSWSEGFLIGWAVYSLIAHNCDCNMPQRYATTREIILELWNSTNPDEHAKQLTYDLSTCITFMDSMCALPTRLQSNMWLCPDRVTDEGRRAATRLINSILNYDHNNEGLKNYNALSYLSFYRRKTGKFLFPKLANILFTAQEIVAACGWDTGTIESFWALSGEMHPAPAAQTAPPGGTRPTEESLNAIVTHMRQQGANIEAIIRHLREAMGIGDGVCGKLLFREISADASKKKIQRLRQQHGID